MLSLAAEWLIDAAASAPSLETPPDEAQPGGAAVEMAEWTIVVPGRRAGRRLLAALARRAAATDRPMVPPRILTPGVMGPALLPAPRPPATALERNLAWTAALRTLETDSLASITPLSISDPGPRSDEAAWDLARLIDGAWQDVTGAGLSGSAVADAADDLLMHRDADRWRVVEQLVERYRAVLDRSGRADPTAWSERLDEIPPADPGTSARHIIVGVLELTAAQRQLVARLGETGHDVHVLIGAPASVADDIDGFGCPIPERWTEPRTLAPRDAITRADGPHDQAQAVLEMLADVPPGGTMSRTVGIADERLLESMTRAATWAGLSIHSGAGWPLARTGPWRLLDAIAQWLHARDADALGRLVRHPDLEAWLDRRRRENGFDDRHWLPALDRLQREHLTADFPVGWTAPSEKTAVVARVVGWIDELTAVLRGGHRALIDWADPILDILRATYDPPPHDLLEPERVAEALGELREAVDALRTIPGALRDRVESEAALRLLLAETRSGAVAIDPVDGAMEVLGWLELLHDDAPTLVIAGMNEGAVPGGTAGDPLLPDRLRAMLGLPGGDQRVARDAFVLENLLNSRDDIKLVFGARNVDGEPLAPSRLLLGGSDTELASRVLDMVDGDSLQRVIPLGLPVPAERTGFVVPVEPPLADGAVVELEKLPVTAFRDYLQCPYRFWLRRIEGLRTTDADPMELDAPAFGSLAHAVLDDFGRGPVAESDDPDAITAFLEQTLRAIAAERFGPVPPPAVRIQLRRLERRLGAFARVQAAHRRAGWRIEAVEIDLPESALLVIPDEAPLRITGRIDRVDRHEDDGSLLIIDYKTSDKARTPEKSHRPDGATWEDLQLPLYEHLRDRERFDGPAHVGYGLLPKQADDAHIAVAAWTDAELAEAIETARDVVRSIRAGQFGPLADRPPAFDQFERICQSRVLGRVNPALVADADDGGDP